MNIVRGMLRISIVAAVLVAIGGAVASHFDVLKEQGRLTKDWQEDTRLWKALRCGGQFIGKDMTAYTNEFGLIDIGRAGCSDRRFLTTFDEIRKAMNEPAPTMPESSYWEIYFPHIGIWVVLAFIAFCLVNFSGLLFLSIRSAARWIKAGFQ